MTDKDTIDGLNRYKGIIEPNYPMSMYIESAIERIYDVILIKKVLDDKLSPSNEKVRDIEMILKMGKKNEL